MKPLTLTLVADGSSDRCLVPIVERVVADRFPDRPFRVDYAGHGLPPIGAGLPARLRAAAKIFPCDVLIVHRDAESQGIDQRLTEIEAAAPMGVPIAPAVPLRMLEAWLLCNSEPAIRRAAGNPNGTDNLALPQAATLENLPDPKVLLLNALKRASGLSGRRLQTFNERQAVHRVAALLQSLDCLRMLTSFQRFESRLIASIDMAL